MDFTYHFAPIATTFTGSATGVLTPQLFNTTFTAATPSLLNTSFIPVCTAWLVNGAWW